MDFLAELKTSALGFIREGNSSWFRLSSEFTPGHCGYQSDQGYETQTHNPHLRALERCVKEWWLFHHLCQRRMPDSVWISYFWGHLYVRHPLENRTGHQCIPYAYEIHLTSVTLVLAGDSQTVQSWWITSSCPLLGTWVLGEEGDSPERSWFHLTIWIEKEFLMPVILL